MAGAQARAGTPAAKYALLGATLVLALGGLLMVYSASSASDYQKLGDFAYHAKRQAIWVLAGLVFMLVAARTDYRVTRKISWALVGVTDALLIAVDIAGVGKYGAQRWLAVGPLVIQPSELAKLACVLATAVLIAGTPPAQRRLKYIGGKLALIVAPVVLLVMAQPDMGTTMSILIAVFIVLMLGGLARGDLVRTAALGIVAVPVFILVAPYRAARFMAFLDPWADPMKKGYQIIQAMYAFGSGGLGGVGLGLSRQKFSYLPAAHTDFIFAIIGEEMGLIGTLTVVVAFGVIAWAGLRIAMGAKDSYGRVLAGGLTGLIVTQAAINMAAVTGLMPVTGIPLPFVSSGGSSLLFNLGCIGLILSVHAFGSRAGRMRHPAGRPPVEEVDFASALERRRHGGPRLSGIDGGRRAAR
jgi:cell division protein FtsW